MDKLSSLLAEKLQMETYIPENFITETNMNLKEMNSLIQEYEISIQEQQERLNTIKEYLVPLTQIITQLQILKEQGIDVETEINTMLNEVRNKQQAQGTISKLLNTKQMITDFTLDSVVNLDIFMEYKEDGKCTTNKMGYINISFKEALDIIHTTIKQQVDTNEIDPKQLPNYKSAIGYFYNLNEDTIKDVYRELWNKQQDDRITIEEEALGLSVSIVLELA